MKKDYEKAAEGVIYTTPAIRIANLGPQNVLCLSGEPTEQYEEGENYGENW